MQDGDLGWQRPRYRRAMFRMSWWVDRARPSKPAVIQVASEAEAVAFRAELQRAGIAVLPTHWTTVDPAVTIRTGDVEPALDLLESMRALQA